MMAEFLFLVFALDKVYYSPLGKLMDDLDARIKQKLGSMKGTSEEVKQLAKRAVAMMRAARTYKRRFRTVKEADYALDIGKTTKCIFKGQHWYYDATNSITSAVEAGSHMAKTMFLTFC